MSWDNFWPLESQALLRRIQSTTRAASRWEGKGPCFAEVSCYVEPTEGKKREGLREKLRKECPKIRGRHPRLHRTYFVKKVGPEFPDERHPV